MNKPKQDPRLKLITFMKPDGTVVQVNSFPASLEAAVAAGWLPEKEFKAANAAEAAAAKAAKAANAAAAKAAADKKK